MQEHQTISKTPLHLFRNQDAEANSPQALQSLRDKIAKVRGNKKRQIIFDSPSPSALIQSMPSQELLYTIKDIGIADCAELIPLATREQITCCLDLDCWEKDVFSLDSCEQWLQFLQSNDLLAAEKVLQSMDSELLVLFFQEFFIIHRIDEDDPTAKDSIPQEFSELITTPDQFYQIEIPYESEHPRLQLAHSALTLFQQYGYNFCHKLFEAINHSLPSELQELSYQFRHSRLESLGFFDYYQAIQIYQPLPPQARPLLAAPPSEVVALSPVLLRPRPEGLFSEAMSRLNEPSIRERIQSELLYVTNKVSAADRIEISNPNALAKELRFVQRILNLGLAHLAHEDPSQASEALEKYHLEWIFRQGFTLLANLKRSVFNLKRAIKKNYGKEALDLFDSPYDIILDNLTKRIPTFHNAIETPSANQSRPFRQKKDIQLCQDILEYLSFLPRLFFQHFGFSPSTFANPDKLLFAPNASENICFSHLFLTALVNRSQKNLFQPHPLTLEQVQTFYQTIFLQEQEAPYPIDPQFKEKIEKELVNHPNTDQTFKNHIQKFLNEMWKKLQNEAAYFPKNMALDHRFSHLFLIADPSSTQKPSNT